LILWLLDALSDAALCVLDDCFVLSIRDVQGADLGC
jgi:hypothetical protein